MSWLQLHDEVWPVTDDEADLDVHIEAPDVNIPRVQWNWSVSHNIERPQREVSGGPVMDRWLDIEVGRLILKLRDWREFAGLEIRADSAWHETQEFVGPYAHSHNAPRLLVSQKVVAPSNNANGWEIKTTGWTAHDFILRFGSRDGWSFPCELDGWLIPDEEYYRDEPETPEEVARFPEGAPNLRIVTRATFGSGTVSLSRQPADPLLRARQSLKELIGCDEMLDPKLEWMLRRASDGDKCVPMPGWRSSVKFWTGNESG